MAKAEKRNVRSVFDDRGKDNKKRRTGFIDSVKRTKSSSQNKKVRTSKTKINY